MLYNFLKKISTKLLALEKSPQRLARSCALGVFIATSPFIGLMTWIAFPLSWIFKVNPITVIVVLNLVNNPFMIVPIIVIDYAVGYYLIERLLHIDLVPYNPSWMHWLNTKIGPYLEQYLGVKTMCFWCYIIGGLIFAFICSIPTYIILQRFFTKRMHNPNRENFTQ